MPVRTILNRPGYKSPILSEATVHNGVVYCAGKVGLDPIKGTLVSDDVGEQTVSLVSKTAYFATNMDLRKRRSICSN